MKKFMMFLVFIASLWIMPLYANTGTIEGMITSNKGPVSDVTVMVKGQKISTQSDSNGKYKISVPVGKVSLSFYHKDFSSKSANNVDVKENTITVKDIVMSQSSTNKQSIVISSSKIKKGSTKVLVEQRQKATAVTDVMSSEQISKSGDGDASGALKRMTGLTLVDGKYIYVRGMGERYSSSLLNGSTIPSLDTSRKVVSFDIFPSGVLDSIIVQKSYSPDIPADFGGGNVNLITKTMPNDFTFQWSLSSDFTTQDDGPTLKYHGGKKDFWGYDDGTREMPKSLSNTDKIESGKQYSKEDLKQFGRDFSNHYNVEEKESCNKFTINRFNGKCNTNFGLALSIGNKHDLGFGKLGYLFSMRFKQEQTNETYNLKRYSASNGVLQSVDKDLDYYVSEREISPTYLFNTGLQTGTNTFNYTAMLTRKTTDKVQLKNGLSGGGDDVSKTTTLEWVERELLYHQISAKHSPFDFYDIEWRYSITDASRKAPDTRVYQYDQLDENLPYAMSNRFSGNSRTFSTLKDKGEDLGLDFTFKFPVDELYTFKIKTGFNAVTKSRTSKTRRFGYNFANWSDVTVAERRQQPEDIFTNDNIDTKKLELFEGTRNTDQYKATQTIDAGYGLLDLNFDDKYILNAGMRVEKSDQKVLTYSLHDPNAQSEVASLKNTHKLPAMNLTYKFIEDMQLRLGYSKTVNRPDFRELSAATYTDDQFDIEVSGYTDLKVAEIKNYDLRLEWYPRSQSNISFGLFKKDISNPIEKVLLNAAGGDVKLSYRNSKNSQNNGWEIEFMDGYLLGQHLLSYGGNYSKIYSKIEIDEQALAGQSTLTTKKRAMQGVSPYTANLNLSWKMSDIGHESTLSFNEVGAKISELGISGMPDVYEQKSRYLDFVAKQEINEWVSFDFKAKNLLHTGIETKQDNKTILKKPGNPTYTIGLSGKI